MVESTDGRAYFMKDHHDRNQLYGSGHLKVNPDPVSQGTFLYNITDSALVFSVLWHHGFLILEGLLGKSERSSSETFKNHALVC